MNFLAHASLSGDDELILVGNFVADSVKGNDLSQYPDSMQKGIQLHRFIDTFTDQHEIVTETKILLRPAFGHYAPVVADVFYDHFLAKFWTEYYPGKDLYSFVQTVYSALLSNFEILPERSKQMIPFLIRQDWLGSYSSIEGISDVLIRMSKRTSFSSGMENAQVELEKNYQLYLNHFRSFYPDLQVNSQRILDDLLK